MKTNDVIKANITAFCKKREMTRKELAEKIGMNHNTFYNTYARKNSMFSHSNLDKIAKVLGISINKLYSLTGSSDEDYYFVLKLIEKFRTKQRIEVVISKREFYINRSMANYMFGKKDFTKEDLKTVCDSFITDRANPILISVAKEFKKDFEVVEIDVSQLFHTYLYKNDNGSERISFDRNIYNKLLIDYIKA